jgi:hypothetical protein
MADQEPMSISAATLLHVGLPAACRERAQEMAEHERPRTTKLYDPRKERLTQDEVERIRL